MSNQEFDKSANTGLRHLFNAFRFSLSGFAAAYRFESAFRQELFLLLVALPAAYFLAQSVLEFVLLISTILFVMVVELLNSAVEAAIDRFGGEIHDLSGRAKDLGSAAVMLSLVITGMIWGALLIQRFDVFG